MAIIDLVRWSPQGSDTIFAWRFPHTNLSTYTQLVVQESQEAVLFSKGQIMGKFGPGKHTLSTENLPILRLLYGIPFGGRNPFTAEVWFVNRIQTFSIDWYIDRMVIHDVDYNTQLPLMASGQYGLQVVDAEKFLVKMVGTHSEYTQHDLTEQFTGEFTTKTKSAIVQYMLQNRVGFKQISAYLTTLSDFLRDAMSPFWSALGLQLTKFYVGTIDISDATPEDRQVKEAIANQAAMSITGHTWQQQQMFDTAKSAIGGIGDSSGGLLGGLLAMQMMGNMGGAAAGIMQPQYNQPTFGGQSQGVQQPGGQTGAGPEPPVKMVYCSNCAKKFPSTMRFCPYCGDPYNPCPRCGTDNDLNAKRCISCGAYLQPEAGVCPHCKSPLEPGSTFCGNCGQPVVSASDLCSRCGAKLPPTAKFCPKCGNKRD